MQINITEDVSNGDIPLEDLIVPMMRTNYEKVVSATSAVQTSLNKSANIGMKAIVPEFNEDEAVNLAYKMSSYDTFEEAEWLLGEPIVTNSLGVVTDMLHANADFQYRSGMSPKIVRTAESDCCDWCAKLEGVYEYRELSSNDEVWKRHANCRCEVTYVPAYGRAQDVYSKLYLNENEKRQRIENYKNREEERSRKNPGPYKTTIISPVIETKEYSSRIDRLGEDEDVTRRILHEARSTLFHRNGTKMEDLTFINSVTNDHISQRHYNKESEVKPTEKMIKMAMDNPRTIIGMHNHPLNMMPSYHDLVAAKNYKYGIILCHNGNVIKYAVTDDADIDYADLVLNDLQNDFDANNSIDMHLEALRNVGVFMEVIQ